MSTARRPPAECPRTAPRVAAVWRSGHGQRRRRCRAHSCSATEDVAARFADLRAIKQPAWTKQEVLSKRQVGLFAGLDGLGRGGGGQSIGTAQRLAPEIERAFGISQMCREDGPDIQSQAKCGKSLVAVT